MEIQRNFNRFNINHLDDQFKKNEKTVSGIAGYHGKLANIVGWVLENIFHTTVHVKDQKGNIYYFNCKSLEKWLERRNFTDFSRENLHSSDWVQRTIEGLQQKAIQEKVQRDEPVGTKSGRIEEVINTEGLEEIKTIPKVIDPFEPKESMKPKSNKPSDSVGKSSRVEELDESQSSSSLHVPTDAAIESDEILKNLKDPFKAMTIDNQGRTLLDKAAEEGNLNAVKYAVEILKWDVNKPNRNDLTPLYYAAKKGNKEIVDFLLNNGALNKANKYDTRPSDLAIENEHPDIAEFIKNRTKKT